MTTREFHLYWTRRVCEYALAKAIVAITRLDRLDAGVDRSSARIKALVQQLAEPARLAAERYQEHLAQEAELVFFEPEEL
jgi:hypothetical protein